MINLEFFPSRRLAFYMVRLFLTRSFTAGTRFIRWGCRTASAMG
jgi:hypothetical protein